MTPSTHVPWAVDCCLACWTVLDGQGLYPIACVHCQSLRCPHATNHNNECSTKREYRNTTPPKTVVPPQARRFRLGHFLRRP